MESDEQCQQYGKCSEQAGCRVCRGKMCNRDGGGDGGIVDGGDDIEYTEEERAEAEGCDPDPDDDDGDSNVTSGESSTSESTTTNGIVGTWMLLSPFNGIFHSLMLLVVMVVVTSFVG